MFIYYDNTEYPGLNSSAADSSQSDWLLCRRITHDSRPNRTISRARAPAETARSGLENHPKTLTTRHIPHFYALIIALVKLQRSRWPDTAVSLSRLNHAEWQLQLVHGKAAPPSIKP